MKKLIKIILAIIILLIAAMIIIPFFFKGEIAGLIKDQANKNLNAVINFDDIGLNMFQNFPDFTLSINNLSIVNKAPFEGDTLLSASSFEASVDIWSIIGDDQIKVKSVSLDEPRLLIYVLEDSSANYNIYLPDTAAASADTAKTNFNIALKGYSIENGEVIYIDQTMDLTAVLKNLNHSGDGDFTQDNFNIDTKTTIDELSIEKSGVPYLTKVNTELDMELNADIPSKKFTLKENELRLNNLEVKFDGFVQQRGEDLMLDLKFNSPRTEFKDLISLIPAIYSKDFNDLKSSGKMLFNGNVQGIYSENKIPKFDINLKVENGSFQYPDLPSSVNNVYVNMLINNPGGSADATVINIEKFHAEIGKEPFDASLLLKNPKTGPYVDAKMKGKINLDQIKNAVQLEDVTKLSGIIQADFSVKGIVSDKTNYKNINASGNISVNNLLYAGKNLSQELMISNASLNLTPQSFKLNNFDMKLGKSDLKANGRLDNIIPYLLSEGILTGNVNISSNYFDVNPFMADENKVKGKGDSSQLKAPEIPENINFIANINFRKLIYDNLNLENIKGAIVVKNKRLSFNNVTTNLLGGNLILNGFYDSKDPFVPNTSFNITINNFDIQKAYKNFVTVEKFVPMAKYIQGNFSSKLSMNTNLNENMMPVWESFNSSGSLNIPNAEIKGFKPFEMIGGKLNISALKEPALKNIHTTYEIKDGRFFISPLNYKVSNYDVSLSGSNGIDKTLDYTMAVEVPIGGIKSQVNEAVSGLLKKDINLISSNNVKVNTLIKGTIDDPKLSFSAGSAAGETAKTVENKVKEEVNKKIEEKKQEVTKKIEEKKEEVKKQVESKADSLKDKMKKEAEKKLKDIFKKF